MNNIKSALNYYLLILPTSSKRRVVYFAPKEPLFLVLNQPTDASDSDFAVYLLVSESLLLLPLVYKFQIKNAYIPIKQTKFLINTQYY